MQLKERTAFRLDKETRDMIEVFLKEHPDLKMSKVMRDALKDYLSDKAITWAKVNYDIIPFVKEKFEKHDFKVIGIVKPDMTIEETIQKEIPIVLCVERKNHRQDVKLVISKADKSDDYLIRLANLDKFTLKSDDYFLTVGIETFFLLSKLYSENVSKQIDGMIDDMIEVMETGHIKHVEESWKSHHKIVKSGK